MQPAGTNSLDTAIGATRAIYAELARRPVERDCVRRTECCQFKLTGRTPLLTAGEALVVAAALRATGRRALPESGDAATGRCPLLNPAGKCLVYDARPFGCRTHFCAAAGGPYSRNEVRDLVRRLEDIDATLGGDGPHALPLAVESALETIQQPRRRVGSVKG
jgi:Fe-S-cluster containining protein